MEAFVRAFYAACNAGDCSAFLGDKFIDHSPAPGQRPSRDGLVRAWAQLRQQFRGLTVQVEAVMMDGDAVVVRLSYWLNELPFGRGIDWLRVGDGLIVDRWSVVAFDRGW